MLLQKLGRTHKEDACLPGLSIQVSAHSLAAMLALGFDKLGWDRKVQKHETHPGSYQLQFKPMCLVGFVQKLDNTL